MSVRTRVSLGGLVQSRFGSVEFPEEVILYCPQCGAPAMDKGASCKLSFRMFPNREIKNEEVKMVVDCECGCIDKSPVRFPKE